MLHLASTSTSPFCAFIGFSIAVGLLAPVAGGCDKILGIRDPSLAEGSAGDAGTQVGELDASGGGEVGLDAGDAIEPQQFEPIGLGCVPDPVIHVALARSTPGSAQDGAIIALTADSLWICRDPLGGGPVEQHVLDASLVQAMWVGDFTGNGTDDVAVLTDSNMFFFEFQANGDSLGDSMFGETIAGPTPGWITGADMNGDGVVDLVVAKNHVVVLENFLPEAWFEDYQLSLPVLGAAAFAQIGPTDLPDVVALERGEEGAQLLVWTATEGAPYYGSPEGHAIDDARDEIVVVHEPNGETAFVAVETGDGVAILSRSAGSTSLDPPAYIPMDFGGPAVAGDITGDGVADIVGMRKSGTRAALLRMDLGQDEIADLPLDQPVNAFAIGDVDGDGFADIIAGGEFGVVILRQEPR